MELDVLTITVMRGVVTLAAGWLLVMFGCRKPATGPTAILWGAANLCMGAGILMLAIADLADRDSLLALLANPFLCLSALLTWLAARFLNRNSVGNTFIPTAFAAWIAAMASAGTNLGGAATIALGAVTSTCFFVAAIGEFWHGRRERLTDRIPMMVLLALMVVGLWATALDADFSNSGDFVSLANWMATVHFIEPIYAVGSAVFVVAMLNERETTAQKAAAETDALTLLPNRRAFWNRGEAMVDDAVAKDSSLVALAFDLDRFKSINDQHGHAMGDCVIRLFGKVLDNVMRPDDLVARTGGEEFAAILPRTSIKTAAAVAELVRAAFEQAAETVGGERLDATVSIGLAPLGQAKELDSLMIAADRALYDAKNNGRNRVMATYQNVDRAPNSLFKGVA